MCNHHRNGLCILIEMGSYYHLRPSAPFHDQVCGTWVMGAVTRLRQSGLESIKLQPCARLTYHLRKLVSKPLDTEMDIGIVLTAPSYISGQEMKDLSITRLEQINMSEKLPRAFTVVRSRCEIERQHCSPPASERASERAQFWR